MIAACVGGAIIPAQVNWVLVCSAMGVGVVQIGLCYGVRVTRDEAWKLVKQFFVAAGTMFLFLTVGSKIGAMIMTMTGFGHLGAVALDGVISAAQAYAVGACTKEWFRRDHLGKQRPSTAELGAIFRKAFENEKTELKH